MTLEIAFVGTGPDPDDPGRDGYAMAYRHANAYLKRDDCELIACADLVTENAEAFADAFDLDAFYEDAEQMVTERRPDVVSVCVPPKAHAQVVTTLARTRIPKAIHCEKPMAATWGGCKEMAEVCEENGVRLTINHQRRFGEPFRKAKQFLDKGEIGELIRVEIAEANLFDAGSHPLDLAGYFTDQAHPGWVLAGLDYREENIWFGSHNENQAVVQWVYDSGVYGLASTGEGEDFVGCYVRLRGSEGAIEIGVDDGPTLRVRSDGAGWRTVQTGGENIHGPPAPGLVKAATRKVSDAVTRRNAPRTGPSYIDRSVKDAVEAVQSGGRSELCAENILQSTELIFAAWESVRRRGRVDLPLEIEDNPLESMVEADVFDFDEEEDEGTPAQPPESRGTFHS